MKAEISILELFLQAGPLVQGVMILLLMISITSWTFIFQRGLFLRSAKKRLRRFEKEFNLDADFNRVYDHLAAKKQKLKGIESIFKNGLREFSKLASKPTIERGVVLEGTEKAMRVALQREEQRLEAHLPYLATVGSISVYIGLFGTVWGIMTAFRALGSMQQATLAMVAPGISEALVATALGLFAAIPAVYAYNRYMQRVQDIVRDYDNLAEEFSGLLLRQLYSQQSGS